MEKKAGIILKTLFPKKRKMVILDQALGKIECVPPSEIYRQGSVIEYSIDTWGLLYVLRDVYIVHMPLELGRGDIQLMHQALELCYFGAPFDHAITGIFELVTDLFHYVPAEHHELIRLAYLFKIVHLLGLHSEQENHYDWLFQLVQMPIDTIAHKALNLEIKQAILAWIRCSLKTHPFYAHFKTDIVGI